MFEVLPYEKKHLDEIVSISLETLSKDAWNKKMFEESEQNISCFVAISDGVVIGFVTTLMGTFQHEILDIAVCNGFRRCGVATKLLDNVIDNAKSHGVKEIFLEVRKTNYPAISMYEKAGFQKIGERKKYYQNSEDAILFKFSF